MRSIMHSKDDRTCFACMILRQDYSEKPYLEEHHVFGGTANRKLSEKYGLKVYLEPSCHRFGEDAVHVNRFVSDMVKTHAQRIFQEKYPELNFRNIFGKNYIYDEPDKAAVVDGFKLIESEEEDEQSIVNW